mmetsp:Transcript_19962/g.25914  ORF Transcript_19962/g.25914 Transcript_19962/m.25914 type:complete len:469 (+) Transcript_19962:61-1467(+)
MDVLSAQTSERKNPICAENTSKPGCGTKKRPLAAAGQCNYWLKRKQRYCKWDVKADGELFCSNHAKEHKEDGKRVPCPLDPNHSVFESRLYRHLKVCNKVKIKNKQMQLSCYSENVNIDPETGSKDEFISLKHLTQEAIEDVINKADKALEFLKPLVEIVEGKEMGFSDSCATPNLEMANPETNSQKTSKRALRKRKHEVQQNAILGCLFDRSYCDSVPQNTCFVEMGAAKGGLSIATRKRLKALANPPTGISHVLIDRSSFKYRDDRQITSTNDKTWERIKIDIRDLVLHKIGKVAEASNIVVYSKHLCGAATCYTIRSCLPAMKLRKEGIRFPGAIAIALCCHHVCDWDAYPNREVLKQFGIMRKEFDIIRHLSSWAICGFSDHSNKNTGFKDDDHCVHQLTTPTWSFSSSEKEKIGKKCKEVLNLGRATYLQSKGYSVSLIKYVKEEVTLENTLLLAYLNKPSPK